MPNIFLSASPTPFNPHAELHQWHGLGERAEKELAVLPDRDIPRLGCPWVLPKRVALGGQTVIIDRFRGGTPSANSVNARSVPQDTQPELSEMPDEVTHAPVWKQLYEVALLECDYTKIPKRLEGARHAILDRVEDLLTCPPTEEHRALQDAYLCLRSLQQTFSEGSYSFPSMVSRASGERPSQGLTVRANRQSWPRRL